MYPPLCFFIKKGVIFTRLHLDQYLSIIYTMWHGVDIGLGIFLQMDTYQHVIARNTRCEGTVHNVYYVFGGVKKRV